MGGKRYRPEDKIRILRAENCGEGRICHLFQQNYSRVSDGKVSPAVLLGGIYGA